VDDILDPAMIPTGVNALTFAKPVSYNRVWLKQKRKNGFIFGL
jgi:hypothetical protein